MTHIQLVKQIFAPTWQIVNVTILKLHQRIGNTGPGSTLLEALEWRDQLREALKGDHWTDEKLRGLVMSPLTYSALECAHRDVFRKIQDAWKKRGESDEEYRHAHEELPKDLVDWRSGQRLVHPEQLDRVARDGRYGY